MSADTLGDYQTYAAACFLVGKNFGLAFVLWALAGWVMREGKR